jgi:pyruvate,orthophosphate dikinase
VRTFAGRGTAAIFVRAEMDADDMPGVRVAAGIVTTRGGITGDGAVAARVLGKPCLVGMSTVAVRSDRTGLVVSTPEGEVVVPEGEVVSIVVEGARGELSLGVID